MIIDKQFIELFRALLNNALKHSKASKVTIRLYEQNGYLNLTYDDDGMGDGLIR
ncbi:hypothetical protein ACO1C4_20240 [Bacillus cereus]|uniref:hypothetical protein n=1 Tax=Bacillus cereus TaxID=1396 RepID=UPI003BF6A5F2